MYGQLRKQSDVIIPGAFVRLKTMTLVSDPAGEILRQFRYHFNSEDALAAIRLSHGTRSGDKPKHYRPTLEKLAEDRERRKKLTNCGFFSVAGQPYEPLGDIFLDTRDLVYNQLGIERIVKKVCVGERSSVYSMPLFPMHTDTRCHESFAAMEHTD